MIEGGPPAPRGSALEVLRVFTRLGLTSFGGPVAHLGYFRTEFVERRRWLDEAAYAERVALCQFLPGPASSQVGMAIGLDRAGWAGALAAWVGFTLPSALALIVFALGVAQWQALAQSGAVQGLKLAAVAVVAHAVWGMARQLCPDLPRALLALACAALVLAVPGSAGQVGAMLLGAALGLAFVRLGPAAAVAHRASPVGRAAGATLLAVFALLLLVLPWVAQATGSLAWQAVAVVYQAGALVFGGGHVVLPLLQAGVVPPGWVDAADFMAGYGAAQAVPGPLFSFAAYLGALMPAPLGGWAGGLALLVVMFLPAFLLVAGALPFWDALRRRAGARQALAGVNAAVVGVLAGAWLGPVGLGALGGVGDALLAAAAFCALLSGRVPTLAVLAALALVSQLIAVWH